MRKLSILASLLLLAGTAQAADFYVVTPKAKGTASAPAAPITVALSSYTLPPGTVGLPYPGFDLNALLTVTGDAAYAGTGATWQVTNGALPAGLSLSADGQLSGTPTAASSNTFSLQATYKTKTGTQTYDVTVAELMVALNSATPPSGNVSSPYRYDFKSLLAVTGDPAYTSNQVSFSLAGGSVPPGLSLDTHGVLSGIPTTKNTSGSSFQVLASYKTKSGQQAYTIVINGAVLQATAIDAGSGDTVCAVTTAGGVKCWGADSYGQAGGGTSTSGRTTPINVLGLSSGVVQVSEGAYSSCARLTTGGVMCWGRGAEGQLGDGTTVGQNKPTNLVTLPLPALSINAGSSHVCAVTSDHNLYCWGANNAGQLGDGTTTNRPTPIKVPAFANNVASVALGTAFTCAVTTDGAAQCWGEGRNGQLGNGVLASSLTPVAVSGITSGIAELAAGDSFACARINDGAVKCWGHNGYGELGQGNTNVSATPLSVQSIGGSVSSLTAGDYHACVALSSGAARCWGTNPYGQLGDGSATQRTLPTTVSGLTGVTSISGGGHMTCASAASGPACWGYNGYGSLGDGTTTTRYLPTSVSP